MRGSLRASFQMFSALRLWRHGSALMREAADVDNRSGNRLGIRRQQESDGIGDIVSRSGTTCGRARRSNAEPACVAAYASEAHATDDPATAGNDRIHPDPVMDEIVRGGCPEGDQSAF